MPVYETRSVVFNVRDYGATGNGSSDDTAGIQAAINAAPAGATVYFPHGTYKITSTLSATASVRLLGDGTQIHASEIKQATANTTAISLDAAIWVSTVEHLVINSDVDQSAPGACGIYAAADVHLDDLFLRRFHTLVKLDTASYFSSIRRCRFQGVGGTSRGVSLANVNNLTLDTCQFWEMEYGIHSTAVQSLRIRDCVTEENTVAGIYVDGGNGGVIISGCYFEEVSTPAAMNIRIGAAMQVAGVLIEGNWFDSTGSATYNVELGKADRVTLIGNGYRTGGPGLGQVRATADTTNVAIINQKHTATSGLPASTIIVDPIGASPWHSYWYTAKTMGPLHYWRLGEASGTVVVDKMGAKNLTYYNAPTLGAAGALADDENTAVTFVSATNHIIEGSDSGLPAGATARTITGWLKPGTLGTFKRFFFYGTRAGGHALDFYINNTNDTMYGEDGVASWQLSNAGDCPVGSWHHVAIVYNGTHLTGYVDGVAGTPVAVTLDTTLGGQMDIGHNGIIGWEGGLDEFLVFARALSADEVQKLYHIGVGA